MLTALDHITCKYRKLFRESARQGLFREQVRPHAGLARFHQRCTHDVTFRRDKEQQMRMGIRFSARGCSRFEPLKAVGWVADQFVARRWASKRF
jgi:hypothetical protein